MVIHFIKIFLTKPYYLYSLCTFHMISSLSSSHAIFSIYLGISPRRPTISLPSATYNFYNFFIFCFTTVLDYHNTKKDCFSLTDQVSCCVWYPAQNMMVGNVLLITAKSTCCFFFCTGLIFFRKTARHDTREQELLIFFYLLLQMFIYFTKKASIYFSFPSCFKVSQKNTK